MSRVPESLQKEIRSVLLSKVGGIKLTSFPKDFKELTCNRLEWRQLGFHNLTELFLDIPDVAKVLIDPELQVEKVYGVTSDSLVYVNATAQKAQYREGEKPAAERTRRHRGGGKSSGGGGQTSSTRDNKSIEAQKMAHNPMPETREELEKVMVPNMKQQYALCIPRKDFMTRDVVNQHFSSFGNLIETSFTERYIFVRYDSKETAIEAYLASRAQYDCRVPFEKMEPRKVIKERDGAPRTPANRGNKPSTILDYGKGNVEDDFRVFLGNLPPDINVAEIRKEILEGLEHFDISIKGTDDKRFAFVNMKTKRDLAFLLAKRNMLMIRGRKIIIEASYKDGGVTPRTDSDHQILQTLVKPSQQSDVNQNVLNGMRDLHIQDQGQHRDRHSSAGSYGEFPETRPGHHGTPRSTLEKIAMDNDQPPPLEAYEESYEDSVNIDHTEVVNGPVGRGQGRGHSKYHGRGRGGGPQIGGYKMHYQNDYTINYVMDSGQGEFEFFSLFVTNFPFFTSAKAILEVFAVFGATGIKILNTDDVSKATKAFVQFADYDQAVEAMINLDQFDFNGRPLIVNFAWNSFAPEDVVKHRLKSIKCTVNIEGQDDVKRTVIMEGQDKPREKSYTYNDPSKATPAPRPCLETTRPYAYPQEEQVYEDEDEGEYEGEYEEGYEDDYGFEGYDEYYDRYGYPPPSYQHGSGGWRGHPSHHGYYRGRGGHPAHRGGYGYQGGFPGPEGGFHGRGGYHDSGYYQGHQHGYQAHRGNFQAGRGYPQGRGRPPFPGQFQGQPRPHPQGHMPQPGMPQAGMPQTGMPQAGMPQAGMPHAPRFAKHGQPYLLQSPDGSDQPQPQNVSHPQVQMASLTGNDMAPSKVLSSGPLNGEERMSRPSVDPVVDYSDMPPLESEDIPPEPVITCEPSDPPRNIVLQNQQMENHAQQRLPPGANIQQTTSGRNHQARVQPSGPGQQHQGPPVDKKQKSPGRPVQQQGPPSVSSKQINNASYADTQQPRPQGGNSQPHRSPPGGNVVQPKSPQAHHNHVQEVHSAVKKDQSSIPPTMELATLQRMIRATCPKIGLVTTSDLPVNGDITVLVMHAMDNAKYFWGQITIPGFIEGVTQLANATKQIAGETLSGIDVNDQCGVRLFENEWARVWVMNRDKHLADVFYVDFGNHERVETNSIMKLPDAYWELPPQAVPFRLNDSASGAVTLYTTNTLTVLPCPDAQETLIEVALHR